MILRKISRGIFIFVIPLLSVVIPPGVFVVCAAPKGIIFSVVNSFLLVPQGLESLCLTTSECPKRVHCPQAFKDGDFTA